jgi:hypothetical protein
VTGLSAIPMGVTEAIVGRRSNSTLGDVLNTGEKSPVEVEKIESERLVRGGVMEKPSISIQVSLLEET